LVSPELLVQLSASTLTLAGSWFYGNKSPLGPWIGIASQVPWNIIMVSGGLWGLAPVNIMMLVIHIRNLIKWRADGLQQPDTEHTAALQEHHGERRAAKAYEIIAGGDLR
jgi:hypothetical protein